MWFEKMTPMERAKYLPIGDEYVQRFRKERNLYHNKDDYPDEDTAVDKPVDKSKI